MPTYEYECKDCGSVFDVFQSIKAPALRKAHCENCGAMRPVRRLISTGGAVLFKGSGFYQTDYRREHYKKAAESESKPPAADTSKKDSTEKKESAAEKTSPEKKPTKKKKE